MRTHHALPIALIALLQVACGGGGSGSSTSVSPSAASIGGTVPGTLIEAFCDNGSYYATDSSNDGSARHPFELKVPAGLGCHLVMVTGEASSDEVVTPIAFRDSSGRVRSRLMLAQGEQIDLGHVPLPMGRNAASGDDRDNDGVLDRPLILDDTGAKNPLSQSDADDDGLEDWDDPDHGGYHYHDRMTDPQDHDDDGIPNSYDHDHQARSDDSDEDGLPDPVDANRYNERHHDNDDLDDDCDHDGYSDGDRDHDGFHDDDSDRDGYHDDDADHDGRHDSDDDDDDEDDSDDDHGSCSGAPGPTQPAPSQPPAEQPAPGPQPDPSTGLDGQALYASFCAECHSPSAVRGSSAAAIASAIASNRGGMGSLSGLSADEVQAIADYLAQ